MLETVRKRLRGLVYLIEKSKRKLIYTDFEDELGEAELVPFEQFSPPDSFEKFREKARFFLRQHQDHIVIHKLRTNNQLTPTDIEELERMLRDSGTGSPDDIARAKAASEGLGLFVRTLVGLDRAAAKGAFAEFMTGKTLTGNQIEFIDMIVEHLTENGVMEPGRLYESPYTDLNPLGVEGLFLPEVADGLVNVLEEVRRRAAA